jgi:hypothetical protein
LRSRDHRATRGRRARHAAEIDENFARQPSFFTVGAMGRLHGSLGILGRSALGGLVLLSAGCAQFQWSPTGPGPPGYRPPPPALTASSGRGGHELPDLPPAPPFSPSDRERIAAVQPWVEQTAARRELDPDLLNGVIWVESRFQPRAHSPAGARGLMQLMPATAAEMAKELGRPTTRIYDPEVNIELGSLYLLHMLDRFDGDETLALAAYNAGGGNVRKWMAEDGELPPRSLQYVENVQRARLRFVAMRQEQQLPGTTDDRTMLAVAPTPAEPRGEVPPPPSERPAARDRPAPASAPAPERPNPLAPSPDVYRPAPTPEPPLADTPYPPLFDEPRPARQAPVRPSRPAPRAHAEALPSVLD